MPDNESVPFNDRPRTPWNKGKLIGAKPPLRPKHVWSIRTRLMIEGRARDLAMFNLAIDSKLRGCDVVASRSRTLRRMATRSSEQRSGKERPDGQSSSS
jgi:hypothetical protein